MKIVFDEIEEARVEGFKGGTGLFKMHAFDDGACKIMRARLEPGASIGLHTHEDSSEIVFIISGVGTMYYDDTVETLQSGQCSYCPKGHTHRFANESNADVEFYAVVPQQ